MSVGEMIHHAAILQAIDFRLNWPFRDLYSSAARPTHGAIVVVAFRPNRSEVIGDKQRLRD
jgi:hypothetical protein